jgi:hypothetical protein
MIDCLFGSSSPRLTGRGLATLVGAIAVLIGPGLRAADAQMDAGSLRVLVLDPSAAVIPGATVTLTNAATGVSRIAVSDGEGYVNFTPLARGTYGLRAGLDGFRTQEVQGLTVDVNERKFLRLAMGTAQVSEMVQVTAGVRTRPSRA